MSKDMALEFQRIRDSIAQGDVDEAFETADRAWRKLADAAALREAPVAVKALPLAAFKGGLALGLYRVHWTSGGSSLAAVGMRSDGHRWIAPTNWMRPCDDPENKFAWGGIDHAEFLDIDALTASPAVVEALANLAHEMRFLLRNNPKMDGGLYRKRLDEADVAVALANGECRHNCDEGGICLAELSGFPQSCSAPTASPVVDAWRDETTSEHIARDMREGSFPSRSEPTKVIREEIVHAVYLDLAVGLIDHARVRAALTAALAALREAKLTETQTELAVSKCPGADDPEERCPRHPRDCVCWEVDLDYHPKHIRAALRSPSVEPGNG